MSQLVCPDLFTSICFGWVIVLNIDFTLFRSGHLNKANIATWLLVRLLVLVFNEPQTFFDYMYNYLSLRLIYKISVSLVRSLRLTEMSNQWNPSKRNLSTNSQCRRSPAWRPVTVPPLKESRPNLRPQITSCWIAVGYEPCTMNQAKSPARYDAFSGHRFMTDHTICWAILPCFITMMMKWIISDMRVIIRNLITP